MKRLSIRLDTGDQGIYLEDDTLVVALGQSDLESLSLTVSKRRDGLNDLGECSDVPPVPLRPHATVYDIDVEAFVVPYSSEFLESTLPSGDTVGNCLRKDDCCWLPDEIRLPYRSRKTSLNVYVEVVDGSIRFMFCESEHGEWQMTKPIRIYESEI